MATLEELQARIQRLDDIKQIEQLQKIYGYYIDYGEWQMLVDLFADNDPSVEEADRGVYKGKEGVKRYYVDLLGGGPGKTPRLAFDHVSASGRGLPRRGRHDCQGKVVRHGHGGKTHDLSS